MATGDILAQLGHLIHALSDAIAFSTVKLSDGYFAVAYVKNAPSGFQGGVVTYSVDSTGAIFAEVDSWVFADATTNPNKVLNIREGGFVNVSGNVYAAFYRDGDDKFQIRTFAISTVGVITKSVIGSLIGGNNSAQVYGPHQIIKITNTQIFIAISNDQALPGTTVSAVSISSN